MTKEECYAQWAPEESPWSAWAKPTLFVQLEKVGNEEAVPLPALEASGLPETNAQTAVVVDLPGADSLLLGLTLARRGFRPVPLYNATIGPSPVVDVFPVGRRLRAGAAMLRALGLRPDAPPAFLLDADRLRPSTDPDPGRYDNRWIVLPQDFPSATFLVSRGVREVLLVHRGESTPQEDLAHVLLRWQEAGVRLLVLDLAGDPSREALRVAPPSRFRRAWYGAIVLLGMRRSNVGGFGAMVPEETSSGMG